MRSAFLLLAALTSTTAAFATVCPSTDIDLGQLTGAPAASGSTVGAADDLRPSCAANAAPDILHEWVAPCSGSYTFDTIGSSYDTLLGLFSTSDCATELACDDDGAGTQSVITYDVQAGTRLLVDVDGFGSVSGAYTLNITQTCTNPTCAYDGSLGSATGSSVAVGVNCGAGNDVFGATCGDGQGSDDLVYSWVAPATGTYVIDTSGSSYDTALTVRDPATCGELACNDDYPGATQSSLELDAVAGQEYQIVVDGFSTGSCGDFQLNINCTDTDGDGVCDVNDMCVGDDASGDSDFDLVCDDTDFYLQESVATPGAPFIVSVNHAAPGSRVYFLLSTTGTGVGPCYPGRRVCSGMLAPRVLSNAVADPSGVASYIVTLPATLPHGYTFYLQAAYILPIAGEAVTEVDLVTTR